MIETRLSRTDGSGTVTTGWTVLCTCVALLAILAFGADIVGIGHNHSLDESLGEHCATCRVQQKALELVVVPDIAPGTVAPDRVSAGEPTTPSISAPRLSPPLRGPPIS